MHRVSFEHIGPSGSLPAAGFVSIRKMRGQPAAVLLVADVLKQ